MAADLHDADHERCAWVLNLDADVELAASASGSRTTYAPTKGVREAMQKAAPRLVRSLLAAQDVVVDESSPPLSARGFRGRAFCPTPRALAILRRSGAEVAPHPSLEVLCRVNSRAFAAALGPTLPSSAFVTDFDAARAMLEGAPAIGDTWRVKRAFGMAGRGQRVVAAGRLSDHDFAFVRASLAEGGVQIEPNVAIEREYAIHGMLSAPVAAAGRAPIRGALRLGKVVEQRCDPRGVWLSTESLREPTPEELAIGARLAEEAGRVGAALSDAGYFGPFGIDAYVYRDAEGGLALQPRSEINARYSMGFGVGFEPVS